MSTNTTEPDDRRPTMGPHPDPYEAYRSVTTTADRTLVYHVDRADQWVESDTTVSLAEWQ